MNKQRNFIESILKKIEGLPYGILIPKEFELKIEDFENFDFITANELSIINEEIFLEESGINNDVIMKKTFSSNLIHIDENLKTIKFYPIALKNYLLKIK